MGVPQGNNELWHIRQVALRVSKTRLGNLIRLVSCL